MVQRRQFLGRSAALAAGPILATTAALWAAPAQAQEKPALSVYSYSSFSGKYGPGAKVKAAFEAQCQCTLNWVAADDAGWRV